MINHFKKIQQDLNSNIEDSLTIKRETFNLFKYMKSLEWIEEDVWGGG